MGRKDIIDWAKTNLVENHLTVFRVELAHKISFSNNGIKEAINQPHNHYFEKNDAIIDIVSLLEASIYVGNATDSKGKCLQYHYFKTKINNDDSFIVVKENYDGTHIFYTIVDHMK